MRLAIYGKTLTDSNEQVLVSLLQFLRDQGIYFSMQEQFYQELRPRLKTTPDELFTSGGALASQKIDFLLSFGGDGTLLDTLQFIKDKPVPVLGINMGRLGFLSQTPKEEAHSAVQRLMDGRYRIEKRTLLELKSETPIFGNYGYALNDFTVHKRDTSSMITIETYLNGEFFNTYWSDGLIVATPTGSTAYSLSCGGPVIFPDSDTFAITPVAPHNLSVRPIVVSDNTVISFRITGRGTNHLISLDSRYESIEYTREIAVQKAPFSFSLVKLNDQNFIYTLRDKLMWGLDTRNS